MRLNSEQNLSTKIIEAASSGNLINRYVFLLEIILRIVLLKQISGVESQMAC
jgi:hypothetical protein